MRKFPTIAATAVLASAAIATTAAASGLKGTPASMRNQHAIALSEAYTFLRTPAQVRHYAAEGRLDTVPGNADYIVNKVSFPYARPEVVSFIERLAREYRAHTGEQLVVTSLTRPTSNQPGNAHKLSVHPAGMAVDLRVPFKPSQRDWLEARLLTFEQEGVLDVTKEKSPPHYHVAVFPGEFREWAAANPVPLDANAAATVVAQLRDLQSPLASLGAVHTAAVGGGSFNGWAFAALAGLVAMGGAAARKRHG
ncbi:MAG: hypothetical protein H0X64_04195 [Gemmatimonadaceae bacterium]|nr:hypothetical protein [Gemmatimonadaceae bacterium]